MQAESKISIHQLSVRIRKPCVVAVHILRNTWRKEDWKRMRTSFQATLNVLHGYLFYSITVSDLGKKKKKRANGGISQCVQKAMRCEAAPYENKKCKSQSWSSRVKVIVCPDRQSRKGQCLSLTTITFQGTAGRGELTFHRDFFFFVANAKIFFFLFFFAHTWGHMDYLRK